MARTLSTTPQKDGFWFPGEFEKHSQTWLVWPERTDIYPYGAKLVQNTYVNLATIISRYESVTVCVSSGQFKNARNQLPSNVRVIEMSSNGGWIRDTGPTFVINNKSELRAVDWSFNAWGNTGYSPWDLDDLLAQKILEIECIDRYKCELTIEGGSFHCDGQGTLLVTEESIINGNRNPELSKDHIEMILKEFLNIKKIIWLKRGIYLDEAGGHIDAICCFLKPGVVALNWTEDKSDPQFDISSEAFEILSKEIDAQGRKLVIHKLHQPDPCFISGEEAKYIDKVESTVGRTAGDRLPSTYVNFYFVNNAIILPTFNCKYDIKAINFMKSMYPEKDIVPLYSRDILLGGGNIHCMTQQQPFYNGKNKY